jgi:glycosyltransferase involved in cell wall biosynthesis
MVPAGLAARGALSKVITDLWVPPGSLTATLLPRLRNIYHPALDGLVIGFNASTLMFEGAQTLARSSGWSRIMRRNAWFQSRALDALRRRRPDATVLCSYSYAARHLFEYAKTQRWTTVLIQIDPGLAEERLVAAAHAEHPEIEPAWRPAPKDYWDGWRRELDLADRIIVHSNWSRDALAAEGVNAEKLVVVPLAYDPPAAAAGFERTYPERFSNERPLRVLFLGQVTLRKGVMAMLDAAHELRNDPVEFLIAGPNTLDLSRRQNNGGRIRWIGAVPRGETGRIYQSADVFLLPTLSDGFALTQLEAQAWQLPLIATANCGDVVRDGTDGVLLRDGSGAGIAAAIRRLRSSPDLLVAMSRAARTAPHSRADQFAAALQQSLQ